MKDFKDFARKGFEKVKSNKYLIGASTLVMTAIPTFAEETGGAGGMTMIDTANIDFTPLLVTIAAVIGVALTPMITVAAGKKGLAFIKNIMSKIG